MRTLHKVAVSIALLSTSRCTCTPQDNGGDDDVVTPPPIDARVPPPIDAPPAIDATETAAIPPDCFAAAERGVAWLVTNQQVDGSYGTELKVATTAFAVLKLETYARELGLSPFSQDFLYHNQVVAGLDYLFLQARRVPLTMQTHGNPDGNGNGAGIAFATGIDETYEHSIAVMALAAGAEPDRVVTTAGSPFAGLTFRAVLEDAVDYLVMAQSDATGASSCARGGWRYQPFDNSTAGGDNSVTQWATLALEYAHHPLYHFEIPMQDWVMAEVREWVQCIQNHSGGADDGAAGYTGPTDWLNAYKTGAFVQQASFLGDTSDTPRVQAALAYLQRVWQNPAVGWKSVPVADYLAMYSIMKGMESMALDHLGPIDWYREFCDRLKLEQRPDGSWPIANWDRNPRGLQSTVWALLVLERAAPPPEVIP